MHQLTEVCLPVEGYEALRLAEVEGLSREEAARRMSISRHTFGRVLAEARRIVAGAIVRGRALRIDGGHYRIENRGPGDGATCGEAGREAKIAGGVETAGQPLGKEFEMAKIAVSSEGPTLEDLVDPRFGRAAGFVIMDPQTQDFTYLDNGASQRMGRRCGAVR